MIGDLVIDIGLIEGRTVELGQFSALVASLLTQLPLVSLSSGLTLSFFNRARALLFTAVWSRTISEAKARTSLFLLFLTPVARPGYRSDRPYRRCVQSVDRSALLRSEQNHCWRRGK